MLAGNVEMALFIFNAKINSLNIYLALKRYRVGTKYLFTS